MKYHKRKLVKVETDSIFNWKFKLDYEVNIKEFILERLPRFNTSDVVRVDTPSRTQCFIITR